MFQILDPEDFRIFIAEHGGFNPSIQRQRQVDIYEFEVSLVYRVSLDSLVDYPLDRPPELHGETLSRNKTKQNKNNKKRIWNICTVFISLTTLTQKSQL